MATETRTVTDEEKILAWVLVMEALEELMELPDEEFEKARDELTEQLLWTRWGRETLRQFAAEVVAEACDGEDAEHHHLSRLAVPGGVASGL